MLLRLLPLRLLTLVLLSWLLDDGRLDWHPLSGGSGLEDRLLGDLGLLSIVLSHQVDERVHAFLVGIRLLGYLVDRHVCIILCHFLLVMHVEIEICARNRRFPVSIELLSAWCLLDIAVWSREHSSVASVRLRGMVLINCPISPTFPRDRVHEGRERAEVCNSWLLSSSTGREEGHEVGLVQDWGLGTLVELDLLGLKDVDLHSVEEHLVVELDDVDLLRIFGGRVERDFDVDP